ncbi:hypothetical protein Cadr_000018531 [Camelus dromedarius]|uniref:Uncharacterized protein n=1 Tax=Camelus dromedarius TaxID=9838 RepID=A0A5N4D3D6_CAMDR|nr:hypothetical protein Cadr_000018531 [Camelus dromedarius]
MFALHLEGLTSVFRAESPVGDTLVPFLTETVFPDFLAAPWIHFREVVLEGRPARPLPFPPLWADALGAAQRGQLFCAAQCGDPRRGLKAGQETSGVPSRVWRLVLAVSWTSASLLVGSPAFRLPWAFSQLGSWGPKQASLESQRIQGEGIQSPQLDGRVQITLEALLQPSWESKTRHTHVGCLIKTEYLLGRGWGSRWCCPFIFHLGQP